MVSGDSLLCIFALVDGTSLLFLTVYFIIILSDLECDYINARTCCEKLNKWVIPELVGHGLLTITVLLVNFHWFLFLINVPLLAWEIYRFVKKPSGNIGLYDPTEIHNRNHLKDYMKESMVKLALHLIFFFIYLYSMIVSLLS